MVAIVADPVVFSLHPKQGRVLMTPANEILYGGAAGAGKSHLLRIIAILMCSYVPGLQCGLFRRLSPDIIKNHFNGPTGFPALLARHVECGFCRITYSPTEIRFANGSSIQACHCQHEKDLQKYQGAEFQVLLFDELTHFTESMYRFLRSRCRVNDKIKIPDELLKSFPHLRVPMIVSGANPGGIGHNWVKKSFITPVPPGKIWTTSTEEGGMQRVYIPAKLDDNPSIPGDYLDRLEGLGQDWLVKAMRDGNWDITAGGAFDDLWDEQIHVMERFKIPHTWRVFKTFDWGSSKPYACLWWAISDGSDYTMPSGETRPTIPGDLFLIHELYGWNGREDEGLRERTADTAEKIKAVEAALGYKVLKSIADSAIFARNAEHVIADDYRDAGVAWTPCSKAPGSRVIGVKLMRDRLGASIERDGNPGIFIFDHCRQFIRTVPVLQRDESNPEDIDTTQEDHIFDATAYALLDNCKVPKISTGTSSDGY